MRLIAWHCSIAIVACLVGCGERPQPVGLPPPASPAPAQAGTAPDLPATASTATLRFDPAVLETCAPPQVGTIHWDASKSKADIVDVKIVADDGSESLFATDGPVGSQTTKAWLRAGLLVIVRDHDTGAELGHSSVEAKPCSS